ncbi:MAG: T9SS type A sorting domain-containing protein, partial [Bacteroidia bacterium]|nr:T9SS type A sorting domain-containing protein [Bacteroidia bacterium]
GGYTITLKGNLTNAGTFSGTGKIYLNSGSASHTISGVGTFGNLELDDTQGASWSGTGITAASGNVTVTNGTLSLGAFTTSLTINGTTTINVNGTLSITSTTGTHNFGDVTVNGIWSDAINEPVTISGNLTVNTGATFTAGTGVYTLSGATKTIGGTITSFTIDNLTVTGTYTNNILTTGLSVSTALAGAGTLTQGTNSFLNIGGTSLTIVLTTTTNTPNTVSYTSAVAQNVKSTDYYHLTFTGAGTKTLLGAITVNGDLTVSAGTLADGGFQITGTAPGTFSVASGASYTTTRIATPWFPTLMATITLDNNSTVNFNGATGFTLPATPATYGNLSIAGGAVIKTASAPLTINGACTVTAGTFNTGGFGITIAGNLAGAGTYINAINSTTNIGGNATVTTLTATAVPNTVNYNSTTASQTVKGTIYYNLETNNTGQIATFGANPTINNNLNIVSGTLQTGAFTVSVTGTTTIDGTLDVNSVTGTKTFGNLTINSTGTFTNSANEIVAITGNLQNDGAFTSGTAAYTLSGTTKTISGTNLISIASLTLSGTYANSGNLTVTTTFAGAGTLTQNNGSYLTTGAATVVPTLAASTNSNTVKYNSTTLAQTVKATPYYHLIIDCSGQTATLGGATTVNGNLTVSTGTLADGGFQITGTAPGIFYVAPGASYTSTRIATPWFPTLMTTITLDNNSTVNFNGTTGFTLPATPATYSNLSIAGAVTKTLGGALAINGTLTLTSGILAIAGFDLTLGTSGAIAGTFSATNMITSTGGNIIKQFTSVPLAFTVFPLGTGTVYTPATIAFTAATFGGTGSISIRAIAAKAPNQVDNTNSLSKYWTITTSNISGIDATLDFTYDQTEADATYEPAGSYVGGYNPGTAPPWEIGADDYTLNIISFTKTAASSLSGDWTAGREYGLNGTTTYYSRATGNWETITTWSTISHTGAAATSSPPADSNVDIGGGFTVTKTSSAALSINLMQIDPTGTLNMGTQTGLTISTLNGDGIIQLASGTFPTVTTNNFNTTSGSTVVYNTAGSFTLPASPASYMNLTVSTGGTKTLGADITVNENLNILTTATLADGGFTLNVKGNVTNNSTHSGSGKIYLNGTSAQTISGATSTFGNIESDNSAGTAFSGTGTTTVSGNVTVTNGTLSLGAFTTSLTVNGATTVAASQTLSITSTTGTHKFGDVTVNGIWSNAINEPIAISGNLTVNTGATFTAGTGVYTLSGATKTIGGTITSLTIDRVSVTGTYTNNILTTGLTVSTALAGAGTLTQGTNSFLNIGGTSLTIVLTTTTNTPNTVSYTSAAAQNVKSTTYYHLSFTGAGTKTLLGAITVNRDLTVSAGTLADGGYQITGNATGTMSMAAGTGLTLGTATTATAFPANFITGNIALNTSTVNYNSNAVQSISGVPTYGNLTLTATAGVIKTAGAAVTVNGDLTIGANNTLADGGFTITAKGNVTNNGTHSGAGRIYLNGGSVSHTISDGTSAYGNVELADANGATWSGSAATTVSGTLTVTTGTLSLDAFTTSITVNGATTVAASQTLSITSTTGTHNFDDVTVNGTWSDAINEAIAISGNLTVNTGATFTAGTGIYTLSGAGKTIGGTITSLTIGNLTLTGTYTNNILTTGLTVSTALAGAGTLTQGTNSFLNIGGTSLLTGLTTTTNTPNTVVYNGSGAQTIKVPTLSTYYHLTISSSNTASLGGATTVNGNLTVTAGTLADAGFQITGTAPGIFNVAPGASYTTTRIATPWFPTLMTISLDNNSTVNFNGTTGFTLPATPATYSNLSIAGAVTKTLGGALAINGTLTLTSGILAIAGYDITLGTSGTIAGTFSTSNMITSTGGNIIKQFTSVPLAFTVFPLGTGTVYTPATIAFTAATFGGTGSISIRAIAAKAPNQFDNTNSLSKYWTITTSNISGINATLDFTYDQAEADATYEPAGSYVGGYWPESTPWEIGTDDYTLNIISFTKTAASKLTGNWTAGTEYGLNGTNTYYSRATGNWEINTTWSTISHLGAAAGTTPPTGSNVDIGGGFTVTKTTSTALSITTMQIDANGTLDMGTQTGLTISTLNGDGKIQLASGTFPTVTTNNFIATSGSTVEYNGASFTLPASPASYMNLTISAGGTKTLSSAIIINENCNISAGTLADGGYTITLKGNLTNAGTFSGTGKIYLNSGSASHTISGVGTFGNLELNDTQGASWSGTGTTTVSGNVTVTTGTLSLGTFTSIITISGTTTINGTLSITSATGTKSFSDLIIGATGAFNNNTVNQAVTLTGNLQNNGTFTSGTAAYTFSGANKILSGTNPISIGTASSSGALTNNGTFNVTTFTAGNTFANNGTVSVSALTCNGAYTNNVTTTVSGATFAGSSSFTQGINSTLNTAITPTVTTLSASNSGNTVNYTGSGINVKSTTYYNLKISNTGTKTLAGAITVNGDLTIDGGTLASSTFQISGNVTLASKFTMAAGTAFTLGLTTSATCPQFPTNITTGNITLDPASSVTYQCNSATDVISVTPAYGNLYITNGNTILTKTLSSTPLNINGNFDITDGSSALTVAVGANTVNIGGNLTGNAASTLSTGTINIGGSNNSYTGTVTIGNSLVNFNGTGPQSVKALTYYNLKVDKSSGTASLTGTTAAGGYLTIANGTLSTGANQLSVTGDMTISAGTLSLADNNFTVSGNSSITGNINFTSATGTKSFNGNVVLNNGGVWNASAAIPVTINGNLQNDGAFTANSGAYTFTGLAKTMSGANSLSFDNVAINIGATYTATTNTTITTALAGAGSLAVGADNSLTLGGTCTVTTFIPENNNATVYFNSATAGQTVPATTYFNLVIDKTDQTATAGGNITVSNDLTVTSGGLTVGANNISVAGITNIDGTLTLSSATGTKAFGDLNINSTGTLTNSGNANVTVNGNFLNDGTFTTPGSGAYIFAGAGKSIQGSNGFTNMNGIISGTITYNCATNSSFGTLNVSGVAAQLTIASDRGLDINTSYTNSGTTLVDASPNGHSGSLKTPATITNTGTCSFKTSIAKNKWHCISSSVTNAQIQAVFTDLASHNNNFYRYDETSAAGYWVQQTTGTMNPGQGYYLYYFNNKYKTYSSANSTYNTGNINVPLTYTAGGRLGWNFVGNPYPSAVDWDAAGWTKTNMEDAVYIKNGSGWDSYVGGVGDCRYIYPGQGFFVKALSGGGTLGFSNSVRLHRTSDNLKNTKENNSVTDPVLKLSLGNDTSVNNTYIRFKDDATAGYNGKWDAYKVFSEVEEYPELYSLTSSFDSLSINSTPFISKDTIIPLGIKTGAPGAYKIKAEQILNFGENIDIFLEDITTGTYTNLKEDSSYTFSSGIINNANRFNLRFIKNNSLVPSEPVKNKFSVTQPFYNGNEIWIIVNYSSEKQIRVDLYDLSGKRIYTNNFTIENESQFISIKFNSLSAGMYLLKISNSREALVKKFITLGY